MYLGSISYYFHIWVILHFCLCSFFGQSKICCDESERKNSLGGNKINNNNKKIISFLNSSTEEVFPLFNKLTSIFINEVFKFLISSVIRSSRPVRTANVLHNLFSLHNFSAAAKSRIYTGYLHNVKAVNL